MRKVRLGKVEHHGEVRGLLLRLHVAQKLPQHIAEAEYGVELQPVRFAVDRRQRVIGAENVAGAVDQKDVVAFLATAWPKVAVLPLCGGAFCAAGMMASI